MDDEQELQLDKIVLFFILISGLISVLELFVTTSVYRNFGLVITVILYIVLLIVGSIMALMLRRVFLLLHNRTSYTPDEIKKISLDKKDEIKKISLDEKRVKSLIKFYGLNVYKFIISYIISIIFIFIPGILTSFLGVLLLVYSSVIQKQKINIEE